MQYQATVKSIVHHSPIESLLTTLDRLARTPTHRRRPAVLSSPPDDWYRINKAASAQNDFWLQTVGRFEKKPLPPLDR